LNPDDEIRPGIRWGRPEEVFTPAFWAALGSKATAMDGFSHVRGHLRREVYFCLLGGFGIKAEFNKAAFDRLSKAGIFRVGRYPTAQDIEALLREPLNLNGRQVRYRFPRQRAQRISVAAKYLEANEPPKNDAHELREWLLRIPGIGMKTASWIVRNHLESDSVAILDVHIVRVCQMMNLFDPHVSFPRDYKRLEKIFLEFAETIGVRPSLLDAIMWREMRGLGPLMAERSRLGRNIVGLTLR
jgi:thermostable 8-oxoguanine DNA glycosylase